MAKHLTQVVIRRAVPGVYSDPEVRGLRLHVGKSTRAFVYRYRQDFEGRRLLKQTVLGHWPQLGLEQAREKVRELKAARLAGGQPRQLLAAERGRLAALREQAERSRVPVRDLVAAYGADHIAANRSEKGISEVKRLFARLPAAFLDTPALRVDRAAAHGLLQGFKAPSIRRILGRELRAAFDHAVSAGALPDSHANPFAGLKLPAQGVRHRVLSIDELTRLLPWLKRLPATARDVALIALLTACRSGEIVGTRCADLQGDTLLLPETKNGTSRVVQLSTQAAAILRARLNGSPWLFPSPVGRSHVAQKAPYLAVYNAEACPVDGWTLHDLRRTAATQMAELGMADSDLIELVLGHRRGGVRGIYNRSERAAEQRTALQAWGNRLDALA